MFALNNLGHILSDFAVTLLLSLKAEEKKAEHSSQRQSRTLKDAQTRFTKTLGYITARKMQETQNVIRVQWLGPHRPFYYVEPVLEPSLLSFVIRAFFRLNNDVQKASIVRNYADFVAFETSDCAQTIPSFNVFCVLALSLRSLKNSQQACTLEALKVAANHLLNTFHSEEPLLPEAFVELNMALWQIEFDDLATFVQGLAEDIAKGWSPKERVGQSLTSLTATEDHAVAQECPPVEPPVRQRKVLTLLE